MIAQIEHNGSPYKIDLSKPIDISIPISPQGPRAWYVNPMHIAPVLSQQFTGSVALGGSVNFNDIYFNPHGHGTHTESVGHITKELVNVNEVMKRYFFTAELITLAPTTIKEESGWTKPGDRVIIAEQLQRALGGKRPEAIVIRTLPNEEEQKMKNYSDTNFAYIEEKALAWLCEIGVEHLLVDLPSVDRESDGGLLKAHHAFWNYPAATRMNATITEFIYVDDVIADGTYLLDLHVAPFVNDASPSRPVLFALL